MPSKSHLAGGIRVPEHYLVGRLRLSLIKNNFSECELLSTVLGTGETAVSKTQKSLHTLELIFERDS